MDKDDKPLHEMATPFLDCHDDPQWLLDLTTQYTKGMRAEETEMTPALHWNLCTSLAEYLHYVEGYPLYEIRAGHIGEQTHIWLELPDGEILDPIAGKVDDFSHKMPDVYIGKKPGWYE